MLSRQFDVSAHRKVGPDEIPIFVMKYCSDIFASILGHVFNISLVQEKREGDVVPVFRKCNITLITDLRQITILNNFYKIYDNIIHDQLFFCFKYKLHRSHQRFY
jgi:hypothetical protein